MVDDRGNYDTFHELNLHPTWTKRATFLWQTFIVSCSKRTILIWFSQHICLGNSLLWNMQAGLNTNGSNCRRIFFFFAACAIMDIHGAIQPDLHVIPNRSQQNSHNFFGTDSRYGKVKKPRQCLTPKNMKGMRSRINDAGWLRHPM